MVISSQLGICARYRECLLDRKAATGRDKLCHVLSAWVWLQVESGNTLRRYNYIE